MSKQTKLTNLNHPQVASADDATTVMAKRVINLNETHVLTCHHFLVGPVGWLAHQSQCCIIEQFCHEVREERFKVLLNTVGVPEWFLV